MPIDTIYIVAGIFRAVLVVLVLYYFGRWIEAKPPKNKLLYNIWKMDTKGRRFMIKYYWQIGVVILFLSLLYGYFMSK